MGKTASLEASKQLMRCCRVQRSQETTWPLRGSKQSPGHSLLPRASQDEGMPTGHSLSQELAQRESQHSSQPGLSMGLCLP